MHVMVLGAGVTGITTAWYLKKAGHEVSVIDRQPAAGLETSYANGGQISVSHPEPWASPSAPLLALRWLGRAGAPLRFRPRANPAQWAWAMSFLHECLPWRARANTEAIASLAHYSARHLRALRRETGLIYEHSRRGILHLFFSARQFREASQRAIHLGQLGIKVQLCSADECIAIEPALAGLRGQFAGGMFAPDDESGDAFHFTRGLSEQLRRSGVRFHYNITVRHLPHSEGRIDAIEVSDIPGRAGALVADAYVLCLGSFGPELVAPLGEKLPVWPLKGYSVTAPIIDMALAPKVSITDESRRIVCSRLGKRLRIAGMAELGDFDLTLEPGRYQPLVDWATARFPGAINPEQAKPWAGLRPATPGNLPVIGRSRYSNLWFNTGHGTLGWTLACGSAASVARLISGQSTRPAFPFRDG